MSEENGKSVTKIFLDLLYKDVKMGAESIIDIMPKVSDEQMKEELTQELENYEKFSNKIKDLLFESGKKPEEESFMTKLMAKMGIAMNTMLDSTSSHIAEIMIKGATMGITSTTKLIREYENTSCSENALALARDIVKYEEKTIEKLKKFL